MEIFRGIEQFRWMDGDKRAYHDQRQYSGPTLDDTTKMLSELNGLYTSVRHLELLIAYTERSVRPRMAPNTTRWHANSSNYFQELHDLHGTESTLLCR